MNTKDFFRVYTPIIAIVVLGLIVAMMFMDPAPPKKVVIAAGAPGGAYAATAEKYAAALRDQHIEVEVLTTAGAVENLERLKAGTADIGIVQTGVASGVGAAHVTSLGAVFYEPLWVFHRTTVTMKDLGEIRGKKVAMGAAGSGVRVLANLLLSDWGVKPGEYTAVAISGQAAAEALQKGDVDVAIVVSGAGAPWLADLLASKQIALMPETHAPAIERRHPYLAQVELYRGVIDPSRELPAETTPLIAPAAQIAVRDKLHPAIQQLLIEEAYAEHGGGTIFSAPNVFPQPGLADIPLSSEAKRYYKNGPSFLKRYFPYNVANFLERTWVLAIPLITLMFPLVRAAPPLMKWRTRRKIYVWYLDLRRLENEGRSAETGEARNEVRAKLADLQAETGNVQVPLSYTDDLYRLRAHIRFVAELIDKLAAQDRYLLV
jgi:TRAP transporter TAXI family solute receptor